LAIAEAAAAHSDAHEFRLGRRKGQSVFTVNPEKLLERILDQPDQLRGAASDFAIIALGRGPERRQRWSAYLAQRRTGRLALGPIGAGKLFDQFRNALGVSLWSVATVILDCRRRWWLIGCARGARSHGAKHNERKRGSPGGWHWLRSLEVACAWYSFYERRWTTP
jgi:hypothetical protein